LGDTRRVSFFTGQAGEPEHSRERIRLRRILFELAPRASSEFESLKGASPCGLALLLGNGSKLKNRKDPAAEDLFVKILIAFFECLVYNVTIRYMERKLKYVR
jgi:hypothetical protein